MANPSACSYLTTEDGKDPGGESPARRLTLVPGGGSVSEGRQPERGRPPERGRQPERGRHPERGRPPERGRHPEQGPRLGLPRTTLTRRAGWFELNPGCFGRAALLAAAATGIGGAVVVAAWRLRALFAAAKVVRGIWRWVRG